MDYKRCRLCDEAVDDKLLICPSCGGLIADLDDLDLSPDADLTTIFKKTEKIFYNN